MTTATMPAVFFGHGSPMNIVRDNVFTQSLKKLGEATEKPNALLVVSAHWLTPGQTSVSTNPKPETIYDFGGFPDELYKVKYPALGKPDVAHEVAVGAVAVEHVVLGTAVAGETFGNDESGDGGVVRLVGGGDDEFIDGPRVADAVEQHREHRPAENLSEHLARQSLRTKARLDDGDLHRLDE